MRKIILWLCLFLSFSVGCGKRSVRSAAVPPPQKKLTVQDLKPGNTYQFQSQIVFEIVTFELPAGRVKDITPALASFGQSEVRFRDKTFFSTNGLSLFRGGSEEGDKLTSQLRFLEAKRTMRTNLMTMDKADEFFSTAAFSVERYVFSTDYGDQTSSKTFLPGQIGWLITPGLTVRRDAIEVKMMPVYMSLEGGNIRLATGQKEYDPVFERGRFELMMREGDFVILAPTRLTAQTTLDKMLFDTDGKKDAMRLYVIIFSGARQQ
jgi:hypothetical protein